MKRSVRLLSFIRTLALLAAAILITLACGRLATLEAPADLTAEERAKITNDALGLGLGAVFSFTTAYFAEKIIFNITEKDGCDNE